MALQKNTGVLLVAFGSGRAGAQTAMAKMEQELRITFPGVELFWAFTSGIIRAKLKAEGRHVDSPLEALCRMRDKGFSEMIVQSLHVIPGGEYESVQKTVLAFAEQTAGAISVKLGRPLLYTHEDILELCRMLPRLLPAGEDDCDAVLLMGHGTSHPSNIYYPGIQYYLWQQSPRYWIATVEGYPALRDILPMLKEKRIRRVWLAPFLAVAGNHVLDDMAGDKPDSWKSILEAEGYQVLPVLKGLAEYKEIARLWIRHLRESRESHSL
jgi:sirohydrochlorin cobaltochelatase